MKGSMPMKRSSILRNTFFAQLIAFIISSLTQSIGSLIDGVVIGQFLGTESIAAFGIVNPLITTFSVFGAIVSTGSRTRYTRLIGEGKKKDAQSIFSLSCILSIGFATVLMAIILPFASPIAKVLGASGNAANLLPKATDYLIGIAIGLPAMNAMKTLSGYMAIDNDRHLPAIASAVMTVTDVVLDLAVVFVFHGDTFEMGLATSLSYYAGVLVLLMHFLKKNTFLRFSVRYLKWKETGGIIVHGLPSGVCRVSNTLRSTFMNMLLSVIASTAAIAAYSVHRQSDSFLNPITLGMAETVAVLAGVLMGEENRAKLKKLLLISVEATFAVTLGFALLMYLFAPQFSALFIKDNPEAMQMSVTAVRCYAIGMPFYGLNVIYQCYLQGIGESKMSLTAGFLLEAGFLMLSAGIMANFIGADAVWYAFPVTQVLMLIFYAIMIKVYSHRLRIRDRSLMDKIILMPDHFGVSEDEEMEKSIYSMDEVVELSRDIWDFCEARGCDKKRKFLLALSVEELAGNIIKHGFSNDDKEHSIDVRIVKNGDDYTLRVRDDCPVFDPVKQLELFNDEDPSRHIGLRMISNLAKDFQYNSFFKLNNLVIKV